MAATTGLRVLGNGEISKAITVHAQHFSKSARDKIEAAGGTAQLLSEVNGAANDDTSADETAVAATEADTTETKQQRKIAGISLRCVGNEAQSTVVYKYFALRCPIGRL